MKRILPLLAAVIALTTVLPGKAQTGKYYIDGRETTREELLKLPAGAIESMANSVENGLPVVRIKLKPEGGEQAPATGQQEKNAATPHEKAMQRALIQYRNPKNYDLVMEALKKAHRMDLVGFDKHCLIRPRKFEGRSQQKVPGQKTQNQKSSGKPGRNDRGKNKNEHSRRNTVQS